MKIENNTIFFKSERENYDKEISGYKSNTVRFLFIPQELEQVVKFHRDFIKHKNARICIQLSEDPSYSFIREITDITVYPKISLLYIFSWK